jgi:hypothetical protein
MIDSKTGFIDLLWKGQILVEHKSRGKSLDKAYQQAKDYFPGLKEEELPVTFLFPILSTSGCTTWKAAHNMTLPSVSWLTMYTSLVL